MINICISQVIKKYICLQNNTITYIYWEAPPPSLPQKPQSRIQETPGFTTKGATETTSESLPLDTCICISHNLCYLAQTAGWLEAFNSTFLNTRFYRHIWYIYHYFILNRYWEKKTRKYIKGKKGNYVWLPSDRP